MGILSGLLLACSQAFEVFADIGETQGRGEEGREMGALEKKKKEERKKKKTDPTSLQKF